MSGLAESVQAASRASAVFNVSLKGSDARLSIAAGTGAGQ